MNVNDALNKGSGLTEIAQNPVRSNNTAQTTSAPQPSPTKQTDTTSSVTVQLSAQYQSLSTKVGTTTTQNASGTFDAKKVADIKAALANGTFQIDLEKVADGLFATVKDLISTRNS